MQVYSVLISMVYTVSAIKYKHLLKYGHYKKD